MCIRYLFQGSQESVQISLFCYLKGHKTLNRIISSHDLPMFIHCRILGIRVPAEYCRDQEVRPSAYCGRQPVAFSKTIAIVFFAEV